MSSEPDPTEFVNEVIDACSEAVRLDSDSVPAHLLESGYDIRTVQVKDIALPGRYPAAPRSLMPRRARDD